MKKILTLFIALFMGLASVQAADITLELCEYSDEYIAWLALDESEKSATTMPSMCKEEESGLIGSTNSYSMSKFTLQDDYVLGVRDQSITNDCWAFATLASIESNLLMNNIATGYLSVGHLELMTQDSLYTPYYTTFNRTLNGGGKLELTAAYVLNYWGPIKESELSFTSLVNIINNRSSISQTSVTSKTTSIDIDNIFYLNNSQGACSDSSITTIKQYLVNHGALAASLYFKLNNEYTNGAYYYYNGSNISNHAVTIVGWDDTIKVTSFSKKATRTGAWLVKNSYGTSTGDDGYFYVSYDDINICTNVVGFYGADNDVSDEVYYYDDLGTNVSLKSSSSKVYLANTFTKQSDSTEIIDKITFATSSEGLKYTVYYASNASLKNYKEIAKGTTSHAGYMSVTPNEDIYVTDEFSIIVKYENSGGVSIPVAMQSSSNTNLYYNFEVTEGVSYLSIDGNSWSDLGEKLSAQASIRVYTSLDGTEVSTTVDDNSQINSNNSVELINPNEGIEGVFLGDTVEVIESTDVQVTNPQTGMVSGISIIVVLLFIGTIVYLKKKNRLFKI